MILLAAVLVFGPGLIMKSCSSVVDVPLRVASQSVVSSLEEKVRVDTVVKFLERVKYKEVKPEVIYEQKVDTTFIEKYKDHDVMLQVEKKGNKLSIYALNEKNEVVKKMEYEDVGNNFTATSQPGKVFVKSQIWYWTGLIGTASYDFGRADTLNSKFSPNDLKLGIKSGISYKNILTLSPSVSLYPAQSLNPHIGLELEYKLK